MEQGKGVLLLHQRLGRNGGPFEQMIRKDGNERPKLRKALHPREQKARIVQRRKRTRGKHLLEPPCGRPGELFVGLCHERSSSSPYRSRAACRHIANISSSTARV